MHIWYNSNIFIIDKERFMKEFREGRIYHLLKNNAKWFALIGLAAFLVIKYWDNGMSLLNTTLRAAMPLIIGAAVAYAVNILMTAIEQVYETAFCGHPMAMKFKRAICIIAAFLCLILIITLVMSLVIPQLVECTRLLVSNSNSILTTITDLMRKVPFLDDQVNFIEEHIIKNFNANLLLSKILEFLFHGVNFKATSIFTAVYSMISIVMTAVFGIIFSIYILSGKEKLAAQAKRLINVYMPKHGSRLLHILDVLNDSFHNFIVGQVKDAIILGLMVMIGMFILQLPYAPMISVIVAVTALVPIIGAIVGAVIAAILILSVSPVKALIFIIFFIIIQQVDNNVTYPYIVGNSVGLSGIWVLAAVTIGGAVAGFVGMLCFVPLFSTVYKLIREDVQIRENEIATECKPKAPNL